jgi:sporulation protein YlmC with PRC-barrel domain
MAWDTHAQTGHAVVESDRIHGCPVFDHDGLYIGRISRLLIGRRTGHVEDVVVHTRGHFGLGQTDFMFSGIHCNTTRGYRLIAQAMSAVIRQPS